MAGSVNVIEGGCLVKMLAMQANTFDAVVTDPPYGLFFMNQDWDCGVPGRNFWIQAARVAKPGAHLLAFGGTRTFHRLMCAIEDAGWGIRDTLMWVFGSGFPKGGTGGTGLKPAWEPIILARNPLSGNLTENVQRYRTGGLNIDGCRMPAKPGDYCHRGNKTRRPATKNTYNAAHSGSLKVAQACPSDLGRWPANLIHDGTDEVEIGFPKTHINGGRGSRSVSRFFYCAKASPAERDPGNDHPTVKPVALMRYLCRLVTPPGGHILDPFMGSGSTGVAALQEGFSFTGIDRDPHACEIAFARLQKEEESCG